MRTLQITIPKIRWGLVGAVFFALFSLLYWWIAVYPYYHPLKASVYAPVREIRAEVMGPLMESTLDEGDFFEKGAPLFTLRGTAQLGQIDKLEKNIRIANVQIEQTKVKSEELMEQYAYLQKELGLTSPTEVTDEILAEAQEMQEKIVFLEKEISTLESEKRTIQEALAKQSGIAPFSGMVIQRLLQPGEKATLGMPILLVCSKDLSIEAEIPEKMLSKITLGLPATVRLPAYPGKTWEGQVSWISPSVKEGKLQVRIATSNLPFKTGLSADVSIKIH